MPKVFTADEAWMSWDELRIRLDGLYELSSLASKANLRGALLDLAFLSNLKNGCLCDPNVDLIVRSCPKWLPIPKSL